MDQEGTGSLSKLQRHMQSFIADIKSAQEGESCEKTASLQKVNDLLELQGNSQYVSDAYRLWAGRIEQAKRRY